MTAIQAGPTLRKVLLQPPQPRLDVMWFNSLAGLAIQDCHPSRFPKRQITPARSLRQKGSALGRSSAGRAPTGAQPLVTER